MSKQTNTVRLIADNGGGVTLQVTTPGGDRYQHCYDLSSGAARDAVLAETGDMTDADGNVLDIRWDIRDWEGNDLDKDIPWLVPTDEEIRNGGYRILSLDDLRDADPDEESWRNVRDMIEALKK